MLRYMVQQRLNIAKAHYTNCLSFTRRKTKLLAQRVENGINISVVRSQSSGFAGAKKTLVGDSEYRNVRGSNTSHGNEQQILAKSLHLKGEWTQLLRHSQRRSFSSIPPITEKKVNVGGLNINFVQSGKGPNGVLLMPGAVGSAWTDFKPQIEKLPEVLPNHTIIAWDPPGYGKSIPPKRNFGLDFFRTDAECAKNLMECLGFSKFSILGWSDGGITALILSGTHQNAVNKLVIWGAGAYINEAEVKAIEGIRDVSKWSQRMREPMEKLYGPERFSELWSEWVDAEVAFFKHRDGDFCKKEVEKINIPTFIVHGKKDPMIAAEHIPYLRERIKGCKYYEFPEGKHNIHLRYADEFNKVVADFLLESH